jgi:hypothetical protein
LPPYTRQTDQTPSCTRRGRPLSLPAQPQLARAPATDEFRPQLKS